MNSEKLNFDTEFTNDDEVNQMIDSVINAVAESLYTADKKPQLIVPYKVSQVLYTYKVLRYLLKDNKGVKVSYELYKPFKEMGSVSVVGKNLNFRKPEWFMKAVEFSDNFEVYPKTNGIVQMNFTFHGLTKIL